jgi:putative FmdB family regulatory protein
MPKYDFVCDKCNNIKTLSYTMNEKHKEPICEKCNLKMKRMYGKVPIHFKGPGWTTGFSNDDMMQSEHPEVHEAHKAGKI